MARRRDPDFESSATEAPPSAQPARTVITLATGLLAALVCCSAWAQPTTPVVDSFDGAALEGWHGLKPCWKLVRDDDAGGVLQVGGATDDELAASRITHIVRGQDWDDYLVGVTIRKMKGNWVGLLVRRSDKGCYEVWINESGGITIRRQPNATVLASAPGTFADGRPHRLEVAAVGPYLRVFVDGTLHTTITDTQSTHGPSGLMAHFVHAYLDDYVQTQDIPVDRGLFTAPSATAPALVFPPNTAVRLPIDLWGAGSTTQPITVELAIGETLIRQEITSSDARPHELTLETPKLSEGLHHADLTLKAEDMELSQGRFPLGVWTVPTADETADESFFPIGVYDKYNLGGDATFRRTYLHAICRDLRAHGLNTLLTGGVIRSPTVDQLDICCRYGIRVVLRIDKPLAADVMRHPAIICCMLGDEPKLEDIDRYKERYEQMAKEYPNLQIVSCMVGESSATGAANNPFRIWWALQPDLRLARYYPLRKRDYGLLRPPIYKGWLPFPAAMNALDSAFETPWWYVAQTFGGNVTDESPDPYWRNPTGPEISAMIHTALAYGASGVLCYCYQKEKPPWQALVQQETLEPIDDKYEALSRVARLVARHKTILTQLRFGGCEVRSSRAEILAVPKQTDEEHKYVYLVNLDVDAEHETRLDFVGLKPTRLREVFGGREQTVDASVPYPHATTTLAPGEAQLWELIGAQ